MSKQVSSIFEFGPFRLDTAQHILLRDGEPVPITPKVLNILSILVRNRGQIVDRDELMRTVWPDSFIEENNITQNVSVLRRTLGDDANGRKYIETFSKRGYRFVGTVREFLGELGPVESGWASKAGAVRPRSRVGSIAVLPFKPLGAGDGDEHLELGLADALITKLSNIRTIVVRPTSAILKYVESTLDPVAIGRDLNVASLLDCRLQKAGERIRVTVQLINVEDGTSLWADKFDEKLTDIFALQDSISEKVASALMLQLSSEEKRLLAKRYTENSDAYQAYLKGRYHWNKRTEEGLHRSVAYFQAAIELDPKYAAAYAGLADAYSVLGDYSLMPPTESFPKARAAAVRALEIDDTLVDAHTSLAFVKLEYDWNREEAEAEFKRVLEINPNYATAHHWYAYNLAAMGRCGPAISEIRQAQQLDPLSLVIGTDVAEILYFSRQFDLAIDQLKKVLEMDRNFVRAHEILGLSYLQAGNHSRAIDELREAAAISGGMTESQAGFVGYAFGVGSEIAQAEQALSALHELSKRGHVSSYYVALVYVGLGRRDEAFAYLEKAYQERPGWLVYIGVEPMFDSVRSDPRFASLLGRTGFTASLEPEQGSSCAISGVLDSKIGQAKPGFKT